MDDEKWLEERGRRYEETFRMFEKKIDTFTLDIKEKMQELIDYIRKVEDDRRTDSKRIDISERLTERNSDDIRGLLDWKHRMDKDMKFIPYINTPIKFIFLVMILSALTVVILTFFGVDPMLKIMSIVK